MRGLVFGFAMFAAVQSLLAQDQSSLDERVVGELRIANPRLLGRCELGITIGQLGRRVGGLTGFENTPDCPPGPRCCLSSDARIKEAEEILTGMTAREAFDHLVGVATAFSWQEIGGVVVVRPKAAWNDPEDPLNVPTKGLNASGTLEMILETVLRGSNPPVFVPYRRVPQPVRGIDRPFSVSVPAGRVLEAVNALVRAHGRAEWQLGYTGEGRAVLLLSALDYFDGDIMTPVAVPSAHPRQ
jgi:hypothetical protein